MATTDEALRFPSIRGYGNNVVEAAGSVLPPDPPRTPGDVHNFTRSPDQLRSGALPLLTNRGAGGDITNARALPPVSARTIGPMGRGYTPTLTEQGIHVTSAIDLQPGTKGYFERTGIQPTVDPKTGVRGFADAEGRPVSGGALPRMTTAVEPGIRERATRDLRGGVDRSALDSLLRRGLERAFRSPDEERNERVTLDQIAWTNKNLGARGTGGIGGLATHALTASMDRAADERKSAQNTALQIALKAQEAKDAGDVERERHLNNVALELLREEGATSRAKIAAGGREDVATLTAASRTEQAGETAASRKETAALATEQRKQDAASKRFNEAYSAWKKDRLSLDKDDSQDAFIAASTIGRKLAKAAGLVDEESAPGTETPGLPKVGETVVKYKNGKPVKLKVVGIRADGTVEYDDAGE